MKQVWLFRSRALMAITGDGGDGGDALTVRLQ
jgi:hypothetical protein